MKKMSWAMPHMYKVRSLVKNTGLDIIQLSFKILSEISSENVIIFGVDNLDQLRINIEKLKHVNDINFDVDLWWRNVPSFPEKLLNPTLWD